MTHGFQIPYPDLRCPSGDGRNFILLTALDYIARDGTHYRALVGSQTDGPSIPQRLWSAIPPTGKVWLPGVLHDAAYRGTLVKAVGDHWAVAGLDKSQRDSLLSEALEAQGVPDSERIAIYEAVRFCGEQSLEEDLGKAT